MTPPRMMLNGMDPVARKNLLAARVEELAGADLCDCCAQALAAETEEFFNKCHDQGGRFCGGPDGKGGPGTRLPDPAGYVKQRVGTAIDTHKGRKRSDAVARVTTGALRRVTGTSTAYGSVKINRLSETKLNKFTDRDLGTVRKQLQSDQRRYNLINTASWSYAAAGFARNAGKAAAVAGPAGVAIVAGASFLGASYGLGLARWKTRRIPGQVSRIERELTKRGQTFEGEAYEFAAVEEGNLPTLAQEIAQAKKDIEALKKDIEAGNIPKNLKTVSPGELDEVHQMINALEVDPEEGVTAGMIKELKNFFAAAK